MASKKYQSAMSQQERGFWREAFLLPLHNPPWKVDEQIRARADFADAAVIEYRKRVTWRQS